MEITQEELCRLQKGWETKLARMSPLDRLKFANSYTRMPALLDLYGRKDFWKLVGEHWDGCDNIASHLGRVLPILKKARRYAPMRAAMTPEGQEVLDRLPPVVKIWRGCYFYVNDDGVSWSLSKNVAAKFPSLRRYQIPDEQPILLEGTIEKGRIIFFTNSRHEQEVVVFPMDVTIVNQYDIDMTDAPASD